MTAATATAATIEAPVALKSRAAFTVDNNDLKRQRQREGIGSAR